MTRRALPYLALAILAGCGGSAHSGTLSSNGSSPALADEAALAARVKATAAESFYAPGRLAVLNAVCSPATRPRVYSCQMFYDFTRPDGQRVELEHALTGRCSAGRCAVDWGSGGPARLIRKLGMDPKSHVAVCERALSRLGAAIGSASFRAVEARTAVACKGVHRGVYDP